MNSHGDIWVIYDGECPFCSAYVKLLRLRKVAGAVHLIDARGDHAVVGEAHAKGFDFDEGMAVKIGEEFHHGDDAVNVLAMLSGPSGMFNRIHFWIFSDKRRAQMLYPWLRRGRNLALRALGRKAIKQDH